MFWKLIFHLVKFNTGFTQYPLSDMGAQDLQRRCSWRHDIQGFRGCSCYPQVVRIR